MGKHHAYDTRGASVTSSNHRKHTRSSKHGAAAPPQPPSDGAEAGSSGSSRSSRSLHHPSSHSTVARALPASFHALTGWLKSARGVEGFEQAYRENMRYKVQRYGEMRRKAEQAVLDAQEVVDIKMPALKQAAGVSSKDTSDNWHIFESISQAYMESTAAAAQFEAVEQRARERLLALDERSDMRVRLRDALLAALEHLAYFASQGHIVAKVVELVGNFLKDPRLFRCKLMNFILVGGPGTGKTTIASAIGDVFAKAGMFVGNQLILAGRAELVGQYEGQTVARTRNFLTGNLDNGVIFIDEAYAITPWQHGKPEGYGSEAATAMVEFMTRYTGLYCIITAGYEREMTRYFLPTNEGLDRRFPYKFVLHPMNPRDLVTVFQRQLLQVQGHAPPSEGPLASEQYFSAEAYRYLEQLLHLSARGQVSYRTEHDSATHCTYQHVRIFTPAWPRLHSLFKNQAGAMAVLADEALSVLVSTLPYGSGRPRRGQDVAEEPASVRLKLEHGPLQNACGLDQSPVHRFSTPAGKHVMRAILVQRILHSALSEAPDYLEELSAVEGLL